MKMSQLSGKMSDSEDKRLVNRQLIRRVEFLDSIIKRQRVLIGGSTFLNILVIKYCQMRPECNLIVSEKLLTHSSLAFAFKLDFDQATINQIDKM